MVTVFDDVIGTAYHYSGMSLITQDSMHAYAAHEDTWGYSTADKWHALTQHPDSAQSDTADIIQFISAGPFTIAPGDSHIVAFALFSGTTLPELQSTAAAAKHKYECFIRGNDLTAVDLGADILDCNAPGTHTLDAGSGYASYLWNTGDSSQTITINSSGSYQVRVSNGTGCWDWDTQEVAIDSGVTAGMNASAINIIAGDTVQFTDNSADATKYYWDFGDGSPGSIQPNPEHIYTSSGTFTVTYVVSNGICNDTTTETITASPFVSRDLKNEAGKLTLFPNPAQDRVILEFTSSFRGETEYTLLDLYGRNLHKSRKLKSSAILREEMNLGKWSPGIYLVQVRYGTSVETFKLLLE